jgi:hypothetical protein
MTTQTVITIDDVRAVGLCVNGTRVWFARHDLDFRAFLREGCDAETLLATGDAMANVWSSTPAIIRPGEQG